MEKQMKAYFCLIFVMLIFISACSHSPQTLQEDPASLEAEDLLSKLKSRNHALETFKGIGKIKIWEKETSFATRVAWLGSRPGKIRVQLLDVTGRPAVSIATDGKQLYFLSHAEQKFYKLNSANPSFERVVKIPVKASDIISLLSGRVPIREHHSASVTNDLSGYALTLKSRWGNIQEKIYFDPAKRNVRKIEIFDGADTPKYQATFDKMRNVAGYQIPAWLELSNDKGGKFQLRIDQCWADIPISPLKFVLHPIQ